MARKYSGVTSLEKPGWLLPTSRLLNRKMTIEEVTRRSDDIEAEIQWLLVNPCGSVEQLTEDIKKLREQQQTLTLIKLAKRSIRER